MTDLDAWARRVFAQNSQDHSLWVEYSDAFRQAAAFMWDHIASSSDVCQKTERLVRGGRIAMMLEGLAIETLAKAVLVKQGNPVVADGRWVLRGDGHDIPTLVAKTGYSAPLRSGA
jgi:hypothetical protein